MQNFNSFLINKFRWLSLVFLISTISIKHSSAQIVVFGNTHIFSGTGTGTTVDLGTNIFAYDFSPGPGGVRSIFRRDNYWYIVFTGLGLSESSKTYYSYRTVNQHPTINPPECVKWQSYVSTFMSPGYQWVGYPSSLPSPPNGLVTDVLMTGPSVGVSPATSTTINPNFIDLANKNPTDITLIPNAPGRVLFNLCTESIQFNTGSTWKSVWPSYENYELNQSQALNFGDANTQIFGTNAYGPTQLKFKANATEKLVLGKDPIYDFSIINLKGSISVPVNTISVDFVLGDDHHTLIHVGTLTHTVTLPNPLSSRGRQYTIANPSSAILSFTPYTIIGLGTSLSPGQNVTMVCDGSGWYKVN
jgi:hypothetical protein